MFAAEQLANAARAPHCFHAHYNGDPQLISFRRGSPMITVTCIISSNEWLKIASQAACSWPQETLSRGEVMRRLTLIGCEKVREKTAEETAAQAKQFREALDLRHPEFHGRLPVKS
jgi:hypothetical protein